MDASTSLLGLADDVLLNIMEQGRDEEFLCALSASCQRLQVTATSGRSHR